MVSVVLAPFGCRLIYQHGCEARERFKQRALLLARSGPSPWQELVEAIVGPEINQAVRQSASQAGIAPVDVELAKEALPALSH